MLKHLIINTIGLVTMNMLFLLALSGNLNTVSVNEVLGLLASFICFFPNRLNQQLSNPNTHTNPNRNNESQISSFIQNKEQYLKEVREHFYKIKEEIVVERYFMGQKLIDISEQSTNQATILAKKNTFFSQSDMVSEKPVEDPKSSERRKLQATFIQLFKTYPEEDLKCMNDANYIHRIHAELEDHHQDTVNIFKLYHEAVEEQLRIFEEQVKLEQRSEAGNKLY